MRWSSATGAARLILLSGASFSGAAVADAAFSNVLELASSAGVGTLTGVIGAAYQGFDTVTVDAGAIWTLAAASTIGPNVSLTVNGTLTNDSTIAGAAGTIGGTGAIGGIRPARRLPMSCDA